MLRFKQHRFIWVGIVALGVILLGMPAVYAQDEPAVPEWVGSAPEEGDSYATAEEEGDLEALGDTSGDLVYTPVDPCIIVNTRVGGGGFIYDGQTRNYKVYGNLAGQGGSTCNSPVGYPSAAHLQVIAVTPNGKGNVIVFPYGSSGTAGVSINFNTIGTNLANAGTTKVNYGSGYDISVKPTYAGCHVLISVLGYYSRPEATPVQTTTPTAYKLVAPGTYDFAQANCPTGYTLTGGGCKWNRSDLSFAYNYPTSTPGWLCGGRNTTSTYSYSITAYAICTRIPGR